MLWGRTMRRPPLAIAIAVLLLPLVHVLTAVAAPGTPCDPTGADATAVTRARADVAVADAVARTNSDELRRALSGRHPDGLHHPDGESQLGGREEQRIRAVHQRHAPFRRRARRAVLQSTRHPSERAQLSLARGR